MLLHALYCLLIKESLGLTSAKGYFHSTAMPGEDSNL